ncbi:uncharacterized protein IL334_007736 [Kwoniella shivajii]|uniref:Uncharacterized protein n=1 Tax=Kwoniella shivajii TaxID=564305 RepID=A0ABZ1DAB7_9TREE|nr:hypothetical protein IL334_007736 [Kwoniella shivajii]
MKSLRIHQTEVWQLKEFLFLFYARDVGSFEDEAKGICFTDCLFTCWSASPVEGTDLAFFICFPDLVPCTRDRVSDGISPCQADGRSGSLSGSLNGSSLEIGTERANEDEAAAGTGSTTLDFPVSSFLAEDSSFSLDVATTLLESPFVPLKGAGRAAALGVEDEAPVSSLTMLLEVGEIVELAFSG